VVFEPFHLHSFASSYQASLAESQQRPVDSDTTSFNRQRVHVLMRFLGLHGVASGRVQPTALMNTMNTLTFWNLRVTFHAHETKHSMAIDQPHQYSLCLVIFVMGKEQRIDPTVSASLAQRLKPVLPGQ
jgi:hypothetical protein